MLARQIKAVVKCLHMWLDGHLIMLSNISLQQSGRSSLNQQLMDIAVTYWFGNSYPIMGHYWLVVLAQSVELGQGSIRLSNQQRFRIRMENKTYL
jgi:hypothetical protein